MISYILLAVILTKLSLFKGWILVIYLIGISFKAISFITDIIKATIELYDRN